MTDELFVGGQVCSCMLRSVAPTLVVRVIKTCKREFVEGIEKGCERAEPGGRGTADKIQVLVSPLNVEKLLPESVFNMGPKSLVVRWRWCLGSKCSRNSTSVALSVLEPVGICKLSF